MTWSGSDEDDDFSASSHGASSDGSFGSDFDEPVKAKKPALPMKVAALAKAAPKPKGKGKVSAASSASSSPPAKKAVAPKPKAGAAGKKKKTPVAQPDSEEEGGDDGRHLDGVESADSLEPQKPQPKKAKTVEQIYQKKTQLEHILIRPDTYIGSIEMNTSSMWVYENDKMVYRPISYVPGFYKIFDEIIVNAADNKVRDPSMDTIRVNVDRTQNIISVYNSGKGIPIQMHTKEGVYVPELIFGHLLTSSNYDDDEKKVTGGRNGYGAKLCNIFSTRFIVETADAASSKKFKQTFSNNMSVKGTPVITTNGRGENYTKITFTPDLAKFHLTTIDDDFMALLTKRVYDIAGCVRGVKVYLNDVRLKLRDFKDYAQLFVNSAKQQTELVEGVPPPDIPPVIYERVSERWEVAFAISDGQFNQVSLVNSICTSKGGTHVNHVTDQLVNYLIEAVKKKDKKGVPLKPFQVKSHLWVFVNCLIENPTFDSQTKENMTLRPSAFGSKCPLGEDFLKKVARTGVMDAILSYAKFKQDQLMKKTDGAKKVRISGITKLDDANNAGTRNASKCTLILTEGDSAKSLAISGLSVVGRDNYGVFPLRGKLLNVREASHSQITGNAEINAVKQILGLQHGKLYETTDSLRYGHLMIMTDQDHDGSHIKGLIINLLDHFWPSLLKVPGFLLEFITPIVKVTKGKGNAARSHAFFTLPEYENWKRENNDGAGWNIKYYKGLGTSTSEDAKRYFSDLPLHLKPFAVCDPEGRALVDMAFNKRKADDRKEWLRQFQPGTFMDHTVEEIRITDFINRELILYSLADNVRSIPSAVDGMKPGHRKILFACFKRNLKSEIKVAQLAGYVSEHSAYHHGEQSLATTIIGMAQNFVGSNNVNVLEPIGQFGTRLQGGKDAASPRYIFTSLAPLARCIFPAADDALLTYLNDDGQSIEPEWYLPILPMLLVNGGDGIGTGWSCSIPNFNPRDIVDNLLRLMRGEEPVEMVPWYRGFNGTIEKVEKDKFKVSGTAQQLDETTVEITELPIRLWTQTYKETLEGWLLGTEKQPPWIKDYKEYHTDSRVHFVVHLSQENMRAALAEGLEKRFKTSTTISTSNMVCFDLEGRIHKYDSILEILVNFYQLRRRYYQKRKDHLLGVLMHELEVLENRVNFIKELVAGTLKLSNRKKADIVRDLQAKGFKPDGPGEYDYLLHMSLLSLTLEKALQLEAEKAEKEAQVLHLSKQTINDLWRSDLDHFLAEWGKFEAELEALETERKQIKGAGSAAGGKRAATAKKSKAKAAVEEENEEYSPRAKSKSSKAPVPKKSVPVPPVLSSTQPAVTSAAVTTLAPSKPAPKASSIITTTTTSSGMARSKAPTVFHLESTDEDADEEVVRGKPKATSSTRERASPPKKRPLAPKSQLKQRVVAPSSSSEGETDAETEEDEGDRRMRTSAPTSRSTSPPPPPRIKPGARAAATARKIVVLSDSGEEDDDSFSDFDESD